MVDTFIQLDNVTQPVADYFDNVDSAVSVMARIAAPFAPHENSPPAMNVVVDAGAVFVGATLTEVSQQVSGTIAVPVVDTRIDRIVMNRATGTISVVTGMEAPSPVAPAIPAGSLPIAQILLSPAMWFIANTDIVDERVAPSSEIGKGLLNVQVFTSTGTYTPTPGTTMVIVEAVGGGGGGGGAKATSSGQVSIGGGGGAGSYGRAMFTSSFAGVTVTVPTGVAAGAAGANGTTGNDSSFGTLLISPGGFGGTAGNAVSPPTITWGSNGTVLPTGANIVSGAGQSGFTGLALSTSVLFGGRGGPSVFANGSSGTLGAGPGGGITTYNGGAGGSGAASGPSSAARSGGGGQAGLVIVHEYG